MTIDDITHERRPVLQEFRFKFICLGIACCTPDLAVAIFSIEGYFSGHYNPRGLFFLAISFAASQFITAVFFSFQTFALKTHITEFFKNRREINPEANESHSQKIGRLMFWLQAGSFFMFMNSFVTAALGVVILDPSLMLTSLNVGYFAFTFSSSFSRILVSVVQIHALRPSQAPSIVVVAYRAIAVLLPDKRRRTLVRDAPGPSPGASESNLSPSDLTISSHVAVFLADVNPPPTGNSESVSSITLSF